MAPAPPSPEDGEGFWGAPTSTLDWCEENYVSSYYVAEYWNTVTNVLMILLPVISTVIMWRDKVVESRFLWANLSLFIVGVGSWCFHMTLLYGMQLLDELPMIWGSVAFVYCAYESHAERGAFNAKLFLFLLTYCTLTTVIYLTVINPLFHQVAYGILVFTLVGRGIYLFRNCSKQLDRFLYFYCTALYAFAFFLWNVDNNFCPSVRAARKALPSPLNAVTQLHGWWHILAGLSTHCQIILTCNIRASVLQLKSNIQYTAGLIPFIHHSSPKYEKNHNM
ncbi:alkaline ceramidase 3-like [Diadema setosum]|uniref:alkaline ceramidase 3-like n=1 Tax=Diadema setosum TaxID=31175 RepID=UPI003B3AFAE5